MISINNPFALSLKEGSFSAFILYPLSFQSPVYCLTEQVTPFLTAVVW
jgi:hypothetical protein